MDEDRILVPVSALQHWSYCARQCGLIHLEQAFEENIHTLRGRAVHQTVDRPGVETRAGLRVERALPIWNEELELIGRADVVEFEPDGTPYPVEYKQGSRSKASDIAACDDLQVGAQALCLEEMTGRGVPEGAVYYASSRRRRLVPIDASLRAEVGRIATEVRGMLSDGCLPPPTDDAGRCRACSLRDRCQPQALRRMQDGDFSRTLYDPDL